MLHPGDLEACFGVPRGYSDVDAWADLEAATGSLPADYKEFVAGYGPGIIGDFLNLLHPQSATLDMFETIALMAPLYQELVPATLPYPVFPAEDGMVQWASTAEGDACFLVPGVEGTWRIGVWFRQWAQWEEYEESVPVWLLRQAEGSLIIPGLPLRYEPRFAPVE
jgi:hypothetical protein